MSNLILVRHGQSEWNLENRFTGWVDVDLAPKGKLEACKSGELLKEKKLKIDYFFSSYQKRAINTLKLMLNTLRIKDVQIIKAWQLNERHYGALTGLNKDEMKKTYGEKKIHEFRRSWNTPPEPLSRNNPYHPINIEAYKDVPLKNIPVGYYGLSMGTAYGLPFLAVEKRIEAAVIGMWGSNYPNSGQLVEAARHVRSPVCFLHKNMLFIINFYYFYKICLIFRREIHSIRYYIFVK